jgi:hypothetical protein
MKPNQKVALAFLPLAAFFLVVSYTDWAANDFVFYGMIGIFLIAQMVFLAVLFRKRENNE